MVVCSGTPFPVTTGGRKRCIRLLEAIERAGATPHVLIPHRLHPEDEPAAHAEFELRGWRLEDVPYPADSPTIRLRQHLRQEMNRHSPLLVARVRQLSRDAAFTQFEEIGAMQYVSSAPAEIPAVISAYNVDSAVEATAAEQAHGMNRLRGGYRARRLLHTERRAARRADLCICVTAHDRDHFIRSGASHTVVVPNGVDEDLFAIGETPTRQPRVLFFGSLLWPSNVVGLLRYIEEVWPRVVRELPDAELRVAGPGPRAQINAAAETTRGVSILGFVPDLHAELSSARLVVAPHWFGGGTRIKVLEALAAARPVVGTTVGVERIGFEHERHGLVADEPTALADATLRMLLDDGLARSCARDGRSLARRYRWGELTAPLEDVYRSFIERAARAQQGFVPGAACP